jgi:ATP-dependent Clp protease ATP-binding subunit ClpC
MFERYTEHARRTLFFARYESSQFGSVAITTEHLLLGLVREGRGLASRILSAHGDLDALRSEVARRMPSSQKTSTSVEIPFSNPTKMALQYGAEEADRLLHRDIGPEHLLLGLLRVPDTIAESVLRERGLQLDEVRQQVATLVNEERRAIDVPATLARLKPLVYQLANATEADDKHVLAEQIIAGLDELGPEHLS